MIYICKHCGREFKGKSSAKRVYCSKECHDASQITGRSGTCDRCGKEIWIYSSDKAQRHFCGQECRTAWLSEHVKAEVNVKGHSKGHKAPHLSELNRKRNPLLALEPNAANRRSYRGKEHRRVMERILGRRLMPDEDVHHINGIHDDNRPENLRVMKHSDHIKLHWSILLGKEGDAICQQ